MEPGEGRIIQGWVNEEEEHMKAMEKNGWRGKEGPGECYD